MHHVAKGVKFFSNWARDLNGRGVCAGDRIGVEGRIWIGAKRRKDHYTMDGRERAHGRSEEHTSELQSLMRISYAVFCLTTKKYTHNSTNECRSSKYRTSSNTQSRKRLTTKRKRAHVQT